MPKVSLDLASTIMLVAVLLAVVLVFWASRPSVIARYAIKNEPADDPVPAPPAPPSATRDTRRSV